jgi:nicotinate phosphoribosyltransferase
MGFIADTYSVDLTTPVMTDAYHFTTPYAYWLEGRAENDSVFYMFGRKEALGGGFSIAGGLEGVIDVVKRWQKHGFTESDFKFLRSKKTLSGEQFYPEEFLEYLSNMKFKLQIDAAPEGTAFFPQEPVLRVKGSLIQVKMLESVALCLINGHSGYMTQGARQALAVEEELSNGSPQGAASVQGLRRGPAFGAALESSRSLEAGGYKSSSTGMAAKLYGQTFAGTMDHAWIMTHAHELGDLSMKELFKLKDTDKKRALQEALSKDAFRSFAFAHPESGILLVDTYDPIQGLENAITVIKELRELGLGQNYGVRFDSGNLTEYSKVALRRFAEEGFIDGLDPKSVSSLSDEDLLQLSDKCSVFCAAADGINEYSAQEMREGGAYYKSWGIGTAGSHVSPLGLVYKAASVFLDVIKKDQKVDAKDRTPVMKIASNAPVKSSNPGNINSRRYYNDNGMLNHVVIYDEDLGLDKNGKKVNLRDFNEVARGINAHPSRDILVPIFDKNGAYVYSKEPPQKESFPGSGRMVTDLSAINDFVQSQLDTLPKNIKQISRSSDDVIKERLLAAFNKAKSNGKSRVQVDLKTLEDRLPSDIGHIPIYLDNNLYVQRLACEKKHLNHSNKLMGIKSYNERFENSQGKPVVK